MDLDATSTSPSTPLTYEEWSHRLCDHFFREAHAGEPVLFYVDDTVLGKLYGGAADEAVGSLADVVRRRLRKGYPRMLFSPIESETLRWKLSGGDGQPPSLPLLALAVLAATRMGRELDRAGNNYYQPFYALLDIDVEYELVKASYRDALPYLWETLRWWLTEKHRGRLGVSTIVKDDHFTCIGYADSQTLFTSSDRDKLTDFFSSIRLRPDELIDPAELVAYYRGWASRHDVLSRGAALMLKSTEHVDQLGEIIKAAAARWRGAVYDQGRRIAEIVVTLERHPRAQLGLLARRPDGFPSRLVCSASDASVTLESSVEGWYDASPLEISRRVLDSGLRLECDEMQVRLCPYNVHVLERNRELGMWASVSQLSPGEPAWLLVRQSSLQVVRQYLEDNAGPGWRVVEREGIAPQGWYLVADVIVEASSSRSAPDGLARIVPRVHNRFALKGGLRLPRDQHVYLTGGEPDVWLPPAMADDTVTVQVDGRPVRVPREIPRLRLAREQLPAGAHSIETQGITRTISTVHSLGRISPSPSRPIAHKVTRTGVEARACSRGAQPVDETEPALASTRIDGAHVHDPDRVFGDPPPAPLILPTRALRRVLIGSCPGEIEEVPTPNEPPWMSRAGITFRYFEFVPRFAVTWILTEWPSAPTMRARLLKQIGPAAPSPQAAADRIPAWADAVKHLPQPKEDAAVALWTSYLRAAEAWA
jgi:hypothetical protein